MLTAQQVGDQAGVTADTVRKHHQIALRARRLGTATPRHLPAPAEVVDGANVWRESDIAEWISARKTPAKRGGIPKAEMRLVLEAAEAGQIDRVITIARRNLK